MDDSYSTVQYNSYKHTADLKVPSGQIGSAREWYHWIGLKKDINRYMFIFYFFF
jgi:hypothetical protein